MVLWRSSATSVSRHRGATARHEEWACSTLKCSTESSALDSEPMTPPREKRPPPPEVPTVVQLGLRPRTLMSRGLLGRCPVCGSRHLFRRWFTMIERCPNCSLLFERVDGHWIGAIGMNTVAVMGLMLSTLFVVTMVTYPDPVPSALVWVEVSIAAAGPLAFFPSSRTLWSALDLLMRPLKFGEVDPRVVLVDPLRDRPSPS